MSARPPRPVWLRFFARAPVFAAVGLQAATVAAQTTSAEQSRITLLEQKQILVMSLIERRGGADGDGDSPAARLLRQANEARATGDLVKAGALIDQALLQASRSYRKAGWEKRATKRQRSRYSDRLKELESLQGAFHDVLKEKSVDEATVIDQAAFEKRLARARELAEINEFKGAQKNLDYAYEQLSAALVSLRDKETVEYRLEFATPADEYRYEKQRYRTYNMLLRMQIGKQNDPERTRNAVTEQIERANSLRDAALKHSRSGDFRSATDTLSDAVDVLVQALQRAGLFLPK